MIDPIADLLDRGVSSIWRKLDVRERDQVAKGFRTWPAGRSRPREEDADRWQQLELVRYLREQLASLGSHHGDLAHRHRIMQERLALAELPSVRESLLLEFLAQLGADPRQLAGDRLALLRWLDTDAVTERYDRRRAEVERRLRFCLERVGLLAGRLCTPGAQLAGIDMWQALDLEASLQPLLAFPGDVRIRESALRSLRNALARLGLDARNHVSQPTMQYIYRSILDPHQPLWLQCEALETLATLAPYEVGVIAEHRQSAAVTDDALFFRRRLVEALAVSVVEFPTHATWIARLGGDASPFVRQGVAELLPRLPRRLAMTLLPTLAADSCPAVAAAALLQIPALITEAGPLDSGAVHILEALTPQTPAFRMRVAMHLVPTLVKKSARCDGNGDETRALIAELESRLGQLHVAHPRTAMRRLAASARERLHAADPGTTHAWLKQLELGATASTPLSPSTDVGRLARGLVHLADDGFGFNLSPAKRGWKVLRDFNWRPRLWRVLHEARRAATDKRQNYSHTRGRVYPGLLHVPATQVAELSQTKVPGEPLHIAEEGGWRPWLPLLDQVLSALDQGWPTQPLRIVTAEGVTFVTVPHGLVPRLRAKWQLSWRFAEIAALRNWTRDSPFPERAFVDALRECGIECSVTPHPALAGGDYPLDPRVRRFFQASSLSWLPVRVDDMRDYFYSIYQNTLEQLLVFVGVVALWFFGQHVWLNQAFRRARKRLPLVMGGWGTRGKSGTERLKAAVVSAMGLRVVSKTTGCEAMFLFGYPNRPLTEMFLFRPYDKATIWEQARLTRLAADLNADVFLWECMGLNPGYVQVLQHDWMRDDVSTITNCFPDHEDIQGPAGVDLPLVIGKFIPRNGSLYTTEDNMLPYLREQAKRMDTPCVSVGWLETGLLTPDIISRFPYQEHPSNIALVARMFEGMGLRRDFALKEMADRVVPDLGVLKSYPEAAVDGRRIEFINGMSANERHGCLSNWERTGMAEHRLERDAERWTCTVVNNRADRVARSQVFASILVNDIGADRHFLIGGNLDGLLQFIREAFDELVDAFDWHDPEQGEAGTHALLDSVLLRWRVPVYTAQAEARLHAALKGIGLSELPHESAETMLARAATLQPQQVQLIERQWRHDCADVEAVVALHAAARNPDTAAVSDIKQRLWQLLSARLVPVRDYHIAGNALVRRVIHEAPPGLRIRCMGIQNIKGTGLDFIYRWQAWDIHSRLCAELESANTEQSVAAANTLAASAELGVLESERLRAAIEHALTSPIGQTDMFQSQLRRILGNLDAQLASLDTTMQPGAAHSPLLARLTQPLERFLDAGDAVRRRRTANQIYRDLSAGRIASSRAAAELKKLNQRQKGGWLGNTR